MIRHQIHLTHDEFESRKRERLTNFGTFSNGNILDQYATFLRSQEWDFFATYTTRKPITLAAARRLMEKYAAHLGCSGRYNFVQDPAPKRPGGYKTYDLIPTKVDFGDGESYTTYARQKVNKPRLIESRYNVAHDLSGTDKARIFWAAEPFKLRDSFHLHALVKCEMTREQVDAYWQQKHGFARIKKYNSKKPGAEYCAKYMTKILSDYDLHS